QTGRRDQPWYRRSRRARWGTVLASLVVAVVLLAVLFPSVLAPYDPLDVSVRDRLKPPSMDHWFGTDGAGRDIYSRMVYAARYSVGMALAIVLSAAAVGAVVGGLAGFIGGRFDQIVMRIVDVFLAFPYFIIALAIASALGRGILSAILALALVWWPGYARM